MEKKYEEVYIERYLDGERNFKNERTVFDENETESLLGEEKAYEIFLIYAKKAKIPLQKFIAMRNITRIQINTLDLDNELNKLKAELIEQTETVGGDDDAYDYFPDLVYAFNQICEKFNRLDIYNQTAVELNKLLDYEEDDELFIQSLVEQRESKENCEEI